MIVLSVSLVVQETILDKRLIGLISLRADQEQLLSSNPVDLPTAIKRKRALITKTKQMASLVVQKQRKS